MCEFLNIEWLQSVLVAGLVDFSHIPIRYSGFNRITYKEEIELCDEFIWKKSKMQEGNATTSTNITSEVSIQKLKRKLLRRSSLRRNPRRKSLEENSSTTSSSPDVLGHCKSSDYEWSKKLSFLQKPLNSVELKPSTGLRERSRSEPSIPSCDKKFIQCESQPILSPNPNVDSKPKPNIIEENIDLYNGTLIKTEKPNKIIRHVRSRSDVPVSTLSSHLIATDQSGDKDVFKPISRRPVSSAATLNKVEDKFRRKSLLEDGCCSVVPQTECFFPQPHKGQSLTSFLSSEDFHTCAELDKENAHFYISEALIAAVEQIKCNQSLQRADDENDYESDEEICHLKQRIRIRRREKQQEKAVQKNSNLLSDGRTDTGTTTSQSASSPQSSAYSEPSDYSSSGTDDIDELELSTATYNMSTLSSIQEKGLSLSMASLYSDADVKRFRSQSQETDYVIVPRHGASPEPPHVPVSAEIVALCLLKKFTEKQLPKASDLEWLVSEQDAPQRLLPLPDSWPISPDDVDEEVNPQRTRLRGTQDWAPPRAQIIFNIHPESSRKLIVSKQKYRCAGCGMRIEKDYIHRIRYCKYLGKYFCHCCHANSLAVIPGYVLHKWDFTRFSVSNFSRDLLERMHVDPLFNISAINEPLFKKSRQLNLVKQCRLQLSSLKDYIQLCKHSEVLKKDLDNLPIHWITEPEIYSLQDLIQIKTTRMAEEIYKLTVNCAKHVLNCPSCSLQGFICEICRNSRKIIFPFQLNKVIQCKECRACFHRECYTPNHCPKCSRIQLRKMKLKEELSVLSSSEEDT